MSKYRDHEQFGANAPINWRERTTSEAFLKGKNERGGMQRIAPPGMRPRQDRARRFEEKTEEPASAKWHHNYDHAMFDGTCIPAPTSESKQMSLEDLIRRGEIERVPQVRR